MLGISYSTAIDMWSFGCILAELYIGFPIFPGESEAEQLLCIMEFLGVPPKEIIQRSTRKKLFFDLENSPKIFPNSKGKRRQPGTRRLVDTLRNADQRFIMLLESCFTWDPSCRLSPQQALECDWIIDHPKTSVITEKYSSSRRQSDPMPFGFA